MSNLRKYLPKDKTECFAYVFTLAAITGIFLFEVFIVLPDIVSRHDYSYRWQLCHKINAFLLFINAISCFWKIISSETSSRGVVLPTIMKPGWRFCSHCECNAPPRSFHCYTCNVCILRRDHHCVFTGNCIGINNHRYYLMLLLNMCIAGFYATYMNWDIAWSILGPDARWWSIFQLIVPYFAWLLGYISFGTTLYASVFLLCEAVSITMLILLGYHLRNLFFNQLTHERTYKIFKYNIGWRENFRSVFGNRWKVAWITPWIPSELPGDGLEFPVASQYEDPKDM